MQVAHIHDFGQVIFLSLSVFICKIRTILPTLRVIVMVNEKRPVEVPRRVSGA